MLAVRLCEARLRVCGRGGGGRHGDGGDAARQAARVSRHGGADREPGGGHVGPRQLRGGDGSAGNHGAASPRGTAAAARYAHPPDWLRPARRPARRHARRHARPCPSPATPSHVLPTAGSWPDAALPEWTDAAAALAADAAAQ